MLQGSRSHEVPPSDAPQWHYDLIHHYDAQVHSKMYLLNNSLRRPREKLQNHSHPLLIVRNRAAVNTKPNIIFNNIRFIFRR